MKNSLYKMMDWEHEGERVKRAFGLQGEYGFVPTESSSKMDFVDLNDPESGRIIQIEAGIYLDAGYFEIARSFTLWGGPPRPVHWHSDWKGEVCLTWDNRVVIVDNSPHANLYFTRAFFHLDFLTPQIESELGIPVSHHQKLEWKLEYEARYGL